MNPREIFLRALRREATPRPATGTATSIVTVDLMEKVGVRFPEAHLDAEKMAALAAAGHTEIGFDTITPLFSVCHESAAIGCKINWGRSDAMPEFAGRPYKITDEIKIPDDFLSRPEARVPLDAIALLKKRYPDAAVVGKAFGPWTLSYHMFGVEEFLINTILAPGLVRRAMEALKEVTVRFAAAQVEAGADAICLADHATRDLCSPEAYRDFLLDLHREMHERIKCPVILHICGNTEDRIGMIARTGFECFHFDSRVAAPRARELAGAGLALMGGTSNFTVVRQGTPEAIRADVKEKMENRIDIIGPECAVPLDAPYRNMRLLVEEAHRQPDRGNNGKDK